MARVRYLGPEPVTVPELGRSVEPDEVVEVPDDRYDGYVCQPATWEPVEEPPGTTAPEREPRAAGKSGTEATASPVKRTAAKTSQKEG